MGPTSTAGPAVHQWLCSSRWHSCQRRYCTRESRASLAPPPAAAAPPHSTATLPGLAKASGRGQEGCTCRVSLLQGRGLDLLAHWSELKCTCATQGPLDLFGDRQDAKSAEGVQVSEPLSPSKMGSGEGAEAGRGQLVERAGSEAGRAGQGRCGSLGSSLSRGGWRSPRTPRNLDGSEGLGALEAASPFTWEPKVLHSAP